MYSAFCPPPPTFFSSLPHAPRADSSERFRRQWQPAMDAQPSYFVGDGFYAAQPIDHTTPQQAVCYDPALDPFSWWYYEQQQLASGQMLSDPSLLFTPSTVPAETLSVNPSLLFAPPTSMETMTGYPDMNRIGDHGDLEREAAALPQPTADVLSEQNLNIAAAAGYESDGDASMGDEDAEGEDDDEWVPESIASAKRKARIIAQPPFQRSPTAVATTVPDDATVIASPFVEQKAALAAMDEGPATSHPRGAAAVPARKRSRGGKDSRSEPRRRRTSSSSSTAPVATFTCNFADCSKGYARKAELDRHVLSHTEAPRACGVCGAHLRTNRADVLRRHQLMTSECVKLQRTMSNAELREKGCVTHLEREVAQAKAGEKAKRASRTAKGRAKARA